MLHWTTSDPSQSCERKGHSPAWQSDSRCLARACPALWLLLVLPLMLQDGGRKRSADQTSSTADPLSLALIGLEQRGGIAGVAAGDDERCDRHEVGQRQQDFVGEDRNALGLEA
jgi:hypothetical protein